MHCSSGPLQRFDGKNNEWGQAVCIQVQKTEILGCSWVHAQHAVWPCWPRSHNNEADDTTGDRFSLAYIPLAKKLSSSDLLFPIWIHYHYQGCNSSNPIQLAAHFWNSWRNKMWPRTWNKLINCLTQVTSLLLKKKGIVDITMNCPNFLLPGLRNITSSRPALSVVKRMNIKVL
jgi:hypothetical protein